jgi:hypothetical protein
MEVFGNAGLDTFRAVRVVVGGPLSAALLSLYLVLADRTESELCGPAIFQESFFFALMILIGRPLP